jgi:hypothetical protein
LAEKGATSVFAGKVTKVENTKEITHGPVRVTIEVSRIWKGARAPVRTVWTSETSASCGFPFRTGQEYLIFTEGKAGTEGVGLCGATRLLSGAGADLKVLGEGEPPLKGSEKN